MTNTCVLLNIQLHVYIRTKGIQVHEIFQRVLMDQNYMYAFDNSPCYTCKISNTEKCLMKTMHRNEAYFGQRKDKKLLAKSNA